MVIKWKTSSFVILLYFCCHKFPSRRQGMLIHFKVMTQNINMYTD